MSMDPEVRAIINLIDKRVAKLQQTKDLLLSEFGDNTTRQMTELPHRSRPASQAPPQGATRKQQVAEFLRHNGPASRREIVEKMGIPVGTIAYVLNDDELFRSLHGKWDVKREIKEQP